MKANGGQLRELTPLIDAGAIRPVVDRVFPFEETREALAYVGGGSTTEGRQGRRHDDARGLSPLARARMGRPCRPQVAGHHSTTEEDASGRQEENGGDRAR